MPYYSDSYFCVGQSHILSGKPCQDYAGSKCTDTFAYAVVADGCSSGARTDIGARLNVLATSNAIEQVYETKKETNTPEEIQNTSFFIDTERDTSLQTLMSALKLSTEDMLATCVYAVVSDRLSFINVIGDGVLAVEHKTGEIDIIKYEWDKNIPFYLAYRDNLTPFISAHGGDRNANKLFEEYYLYGSDKILYCSNPYKYSINEGIQGISIPLTGGEKNIAIFTDGVTQIDQYDWREAVLAMLKFKTLDGEFAKRRAIREIKNSFKRGKGPQDDFSYAVIRVSDD
jgi:hypothetical protein